MAKIKTNLNDRQKKNIQNIFVSQKTKQFSVS